MTRIRERDGHFKKGKDKEQKENILLNKTYTNKTHWTNEFSMIGINKNYM
jgi:hypothetical protein